MKATIKADGIITIPVSFSPCWKIIEESIHLKGYHKGCGGLIGYKFYCKKCGKETERHEIGKCWQLSKDEVIYLKDDEVKKLKNEDDGEIVLYGFTALDWQKLCSALIFAKRSYYLSAVRGKGMDKVFYLFKKAMIEEKVVAVVKLIKKTSEHLGIIVPMGKVLVFVEIAWSRIKPNVSEEEIEKEKNLKKKDVEITREWIKMNTNGWWIDKKVKNEYKERFEKLILSKNKKEIPEAEKFFENLKIKTNPFALAVEKKKG